ncbi:MAG: hypothetical protein ACK5YA_00960 [bacterium]
MAYKEEFKRKVLFEEKKQNEMKGKLDRLQEHFIKFDRGDINSDKLINKIQGELGIEVSDKLVHILKSTGLDNKNFRSVLKNLEILKDDKTEYRQASEKLRNFSYNKAEDAEFRKKLKQSKYLCIKKL